MRRGDARPSRLVRQLLGLPGWQIHDISENEHDFLIEATPPRPSVCRNCGKGSRLQKIGKFPLLVMHTPVLGKRVGISMNRDRYKCKECETTFYYRPEEVSEGRGVTLALNEWVWDQSLRRNFADVARDVGLDERTIAKMFMSEFHRRETVSPRPAPKWIGVDEVKLLSWKRSQKPPVCGDKFQCILTDFETGTIYDLLPNRSTETLRARLIKLKAGGRAPDGFVIDMNKDYRATIRGVFPRAEIVADKFHVTQQIDKAFTKVRTNLQGTLRREAKALAAKGEETRARELVSLAKGLQREAVRLVKKPKIKAKLKKKPRRERKKKKVFVETALFDGFEVWFGRHPELRAAYEAKEQLYEMYHTRQRAEAARRFDAWVESLTDDVRPAYAGLIKMFENWRQEIFNGWNRFYGQPSNGRTEAANGVMKQRKRVGRGYEFETYRAFAIYGVGRLERRPRFGEGWEDSAPIRKRRKLMPKKERKRKHPGDRTPRDVAKLDWEKEVETDEARRPKPPENQLAIGL